MKKKRILIAILSCLSLFFGIERLYYRYNGGFSIAKITSKQPHVETPIPPLLLKKIDPLLHQPFHFLSYGGTSFVFLGEDGKTILKLFKHHHFQNDHPLLRLHLPGASDRWRLEKILKREKKHLHKRQSFFFNSCQLADEHLQNETGLIFLSLQPNAQFKENIQLIDTWGFSHYLDLSRTEFALQHKAEPFFTYLEKQLHDKEQAKVAIDSLIAQILHRCSCGIGNRDPNLASNFGFHEGKAIELDLGSYFAKPQLKDPLAKASELFFSTYALQRWLEIHAPDLLEYLINQIATIQR